jgi:hypothetical protein
MEFPFHKRRLSENSGPWVTTAAPSRRAAVIENSAAIFTRRIYVNAHEEHHDRPAMLLAKIPKKIDSVP